MFIFFWVALSVLVGWFCRRKGLSFGLGLFVSLVLSPLIGFFVALLSRPDHKVIEKRELAAGDKRKCPFCAELIKTEAVVCRFCGKEVPNVR